MEHALALERPDTLALGGEHDRRQVDLEIVRELQRPPDRLADLGKWDGRERPRIALSEVA